MKNIGLTLKNARKNKDYTQKRVMELDLPLKMRGKIKTIHKNVSWN